MTPSSQTRRDGRATVIAGILLAFLAATLAAAQTPSHGAAGNPPPRRIHFSGFDWTVKSSAVPVGPGPNVFSDSSENVWVDDRGNLHLRISYREGRWWSAEVICSCSLGFGKYAFRIPAETIRDLDANAVLGLFNWSDEPAFAHREIDFELSNWGQARNDTGNAQFVVQPYDQPGHVNRFHLTAHGAALLTYTWLPTRVLFKAVTAPSELVQEFDFLSNVPAPGGGPRINLWLLGAEPQQGKDVNILVESFSFQLP